MANILWQDHGAVRLITINRPDQMNSLDFAANEELVAGFLAGRLRFMDIPRHIETVMNRYHNSAARTIEDLLETDGWARAAARELIGARPVAA